MKYSNQWLLILFFSFFNLVAWGMEGSEECKLEAMFYKLKQVTEINDPSWQTHLNKIKLADIRKMFSSNKTENVCNTITEILFTQNLDVFGLEKIYHDGSVKNIFNIAAKLSPPDQRSKNPDIINFQADASGWIYDWLLLIVRAADYLHQAKLTDGHFEENYKLLHNLLCPPVSTREEYIDAMEEKLSNLNSDTLYAFMDKFILGLLLNSDLKDVDWLLAHLTI